MRLTFEQIEAIYLDEDNGIGENINLDECKEPSHSEFCYLYTTQDGAQKHLTPEGEVK